MIGAIVGDIVGSRFEHHNRKTKDFSLFHPKCHFTDDTVMTLAFAECAMEYPEIWERFLGGTIELHQYFSRKVQIFGRKYPRCGYGSKFKDWLYADYPYPYNSRGNGAAMRISACGWIYDSIGEVANVAQVLTTITTHDHQDGITGAVATAVCIYLARMGKSKEEIRRYVEDNYYKLDFTLDEIRPTYVFDSSCPGTVPQAIEAFLESTSFEDAVRNAVSIGGDSDTLAAIAGSIAEAFYGVPELIRETGIDYLDPFLKFSLRRFEERFPKSVKLAL